MMGGPQVDYLPLFDPRADVTRVHELLFFVGFEDWAAARGRLQQMAGQGAARERLLDCLPMLLRHLADSVHPDQALLNFERLAAAVSDREELFRYLHENPRAVEILTRLFIGSQFLSEILLSNPEYLAKLTRHRTLAEIKSVAQLKSEADEFLSRATDEAERLNGLRQFQRWELLRIGVCDFFGLLDLRRVTVQLSLLADSLIQRALELIHGDKSQAGCGWTVLALGKLGGEELNYSSDIDLLFISRQSQPELVRQAQRLVQALSAVTGYGFLYRVDLRLRPWGRSGQLITPIEDYLNYLRDSAQLWERQALLKCRIVAGDSALGQEFLQAAQPLIFVHPPEAVRVKIREMKQRIEDDLKRKGRTWGEVKLGQGSIRDIEFVCQYLQLANGGENRDVRSFNTLDALVRLVDLGYLQADEFRILSDGYIFFRTIEHSLQLVQNKQTHEMPTDPGELLFLARRLDFQTDTQFLDHYQRHCAAVRMVFDRHLESRGPARIAAPQPAADETVQRPEPPPRMRQHLQRMVPDYARLFTRSAIEHHAALAEALSAERPILVDAVPAQEEGCWKVTIVGYDFHGELSLITGLFLAYGFNIVDGHVFTYDLVQPSISASQRKSTGPRISAAEQRSTTDRKRARRDSPPPELKDQRRKIVDVFTVRPLDQPISEATWQSYAAELAGLVEQVQAGKHEEAQRALVRRVAASLRGTVADLQGVLYPIEIEVDNEVSDQYTVLLIRARDTVGFLYELTSALAIHGISIARLTVGYALHDASDFIDVTDLHGRKIVDPARIRELKAATVLIKHFTHLLPSCPNPENALLHFREFVLQLFTRPNWPDEIADLERSEVLSALARLLGVSDFLWNDFLRMQHENLFPLVRDVDALVTRKSRDSLETELLALVEQAGANWRTALNEFKDREMFRVDMRQILGHAGDFARFSEELTDVAELTVACASRYCFKELGQQHGWPQTEAGLPCPYAVVALGKCGGREMGFASDIELMFLYQTEGTTSGRDKLSNTEFFARHVELFRQAIQSRREGIFEIDLRLRPYGQAGSLAVSLESFRQYFGPSGAAWPYERQALVKLRVIAGDPQFGQQIESLRNQMIYTGEPFDVAALRGIRERQMRQLITPGRFNAKLSPGGLVDVEYLVQGLQITHGADRPELRCTNTLDAIQALMEADVLVPTDAQQLSDAFLFLRSVIGGLRMVRGNARELTVPDVGSEEFAFLCRRLGYDEPDQLAADLAWHTASVQEISQRLLK